MDEAATPCSSLPKLPQELKQIIIAHLDPPDLVSIRLTCRALEVSSCETFADHFFSTVKYDFSAYDTAYLRALSDESRFISRVKTLRICTTKCTIPLDARLPYYVGKKPWGLGYTWTRDSIGALTGKHAAVDALGAMLVDKFVNCRNFTVTSQDAEPTDLISELHLADSDALAALLQVLRNTQVKLDSLHVQFCTEDPFDEHYAELDYRRLFPCLTSAVGPLGLPELLLEDLTSFTLQILPQDTGQGVTVRSVSHFITCASNLRNLHLGFGREKRFANALLGTFQPSEAILPRLQSLKIAHATVHEYALADFLLVVAKSLTRLCIEGMYLGTGTWRSLFAEMAETMLVLEDLEVRYRLRDLKPSGVIMPEIYQLSKHRGKDMRSRLRDASKLPLWHYEADTL